MTRSKWLNHWSKGRIMGLADRIVCEAHDEVWRINCSQDITLAYDAENHVTSITGSGITASYVYDGDGQRVKATVGATTTVYIGNTYERDNGTTVRKYYYAGAVRVALRTGGNTFYLLNDHLTSTAITTNSSDVRLTELRYFAYGGTRYDAGGQMTLYRYTGQRVETGTGLYDYGARWYDPYLILTKPKGWGRSTGPVPVRMHGPISARSVDISFVR